MLREREKDITIKEEEERNERSPKLGLSNNDVKT